MRLEGVGPDGQDRLGRSHAFVVGVGAIGCVSADLLARAGVGTLTIVDRDVVERSNLHRQPLYSDDDARRGVPKAIAARDRLNRVNPEVRVEARSEDFTPARARKRFLKGTAQPDVLIDGTDNFETRYLLNDISVRFGIPYVYGGAIATRGSVGVFVPEKGACLRCVAPDPPAPGSQPTCESAGVLGTVTAIVGAMQAHEALTVLLGHPDRASRQLVAFDPWDGSRTSIDLTTGRDPECPCCSCRSFEFLDAPARIPEQLCGRLAVQIDPRDLGGVDLDHVIASLGAADDGIGDGYVRAAVDHAGATLGVICFADGRAIIEGTDDPALARSVYARYIGN